MASGGCMKVTKYFLFLFNLLFFILGAVILGFGIWVLVDKTSFIAVLQSSSSSLKIGSYILIAVGGFTMVMGFLGCVGAVNEVRCLLGLYFTFLLLILILQIVAGVLIYFQKNTLKSEVSSIIHKLIVEYDPSDTPKSADSTWDYIQHNLKCCGWTSYQNWTENPNVGNRTNYFPCSCDANETRVTSGFCNSTVPALFPAGCEAQVESWLQDNLAIILGVCVGVAVIELIGLILSMCLCRNIQNEDYTKVPKY